MSAAIRRAWATAMAPGGLTRKRFGILAVVSMLATGVVIGAALSSGSSASLAAVTAHRQVAVTGTPAGTAVADADAASADTTATADAGAATSTTDTGGATADAPPTADASAVSADAGLDTGVDTTIDTSGTTTTPTTTDGTTTTPTTTTPTPTSDIKHVFVIALSSAGFDATFGAASATPYLANELRPKGELLTAYSLVGHPELPNEIALVSGQQPNAQTEAGCPTYSEFPANMKANSQGLVPGDGCVYPVDVLTIADQLTSARQTWKAYAENMASGAPASKTCRHPAFGEADSTAQAAGGGQYATRRNPFVYFHSLLDLGACATNDVALEELSADLGSIKKTPSFAFIAPGPCETGQDAACGDAFLQATVPKILASPAYKKDGLLAVTFVDGPNGDTGPVGTLLLSPFVTAGTTSATAYTPYSLLRSVEDLFGLDHLGKASEPDVAAFGADVFKDASPAQGRGD